MSFWSTLLGKKDKREFRYLSGQVSNVLHEFVQSDDFVEGGCYCINVHTSSNKEKDRCNDIYFPSQNEMGSMIHL